MYKCVFLVNFKMMEKVDIKIGFRFLEEKLDEWVKVKKEVLKND